MSHSFARTATVAIALSLLSSTPLAAFAGQEGDSNPPTPVTAADTNTTAAANVDNVGPVTIPERTAIKLMVDQDMRSGDIKENAEVRFEVEKDVTDDKGKLLIKSGTSAFGKVTKSKHHGAFGAPGKLDFTCDFIQMPDGTKVPLRQQELSSSGRDNRTATVATAILITPVALFIHGRDVSVKRGTEYIMYVDKSTTTGQTPTATAQAPTNSSTAGKSVFMTKNGKAYVGKLISFDGSSYSIATDAGNVILNASDVKSVTPVQ